MLNRYSVCSPAYVCVCVGQFSTGAASGSHWWGARGKTLCVCGWVGVWGVCCVVAFVTALVSLHLLLICCSKQTRSCSVWAPDINDSSHHESAAILLSDQTHYFYLLNQKTTESESHWKRDLNHIITETLLTPDGKKTPRNHTQHPSNHIAAT